MAPVYNGAMANDELDRLLALDTMTEPSDAEHLDQVAHVALTVAHHTDPSRIGERALLFSIAGPGRVEVSRLVPFFAQPGSAQAAPLSDFGLSRRPLVIEVGGGGVRLTPGGTRVVVGGQPLTGRRGLSALELHAGVVLDLGGRVVLLLHTHLLTSELPPELDMVGASSALVRLREDLVRVADIDVPVLLRGESGVGKELAARAIHQAGQRRGGPFLGINIAAVPPTMAASELFGHVRGAFTGAVADKPGFFVNANGGTLFLDEVGDTPPDVQTSLLRVLETREVQPLGARRPQKVDVRLVAATDADLEGRVAAGSFRNALLQRLAGYHIHVPPLRVRRDDIPRIFVRFLTEELRRAGESHRLTPPDSRSPGWVPASLAVRLLNHSWPGNVRQLRNVARQLAIHNRWRDRFDTAILDDLLAEPLASPALAPAAAVTIGRARGPRRAPASIGEEELVKTFREHQFRLGPTAKALGISRNSLFAMFERSDRLRRPKDLTADELQECGDAHGWELGEMSRALEVSVRGLQLRMRELGLR